MPLRRLCVSYVLVGYGEGNVGRVQSGMRRQDPGPDSISRSSGGGAGGISNAFSRISRMSSGSGSMPITCSGIEGSLSSIPSELPVSTGPRVATAECGTMTRTRARASASDNRGIGLLT